MSIATDDLRAAVGAGIISEQQAASLTALADERAGYRAARAEVDEPFELFKGFNEIFIVVGLCVLYAGWSVLTGIQIFTSANTDAAATTFAMLQMAVVTLMAQYFTSKRRMVAPSIALSIFFAIGAVQAGFGVAGTIGLSNDLILAIGFLISAGLLIGYWFVFRVPFALLLCGLAIFGCAVSFARLGGGEFEDIEDIFVLSTGWSMSLITIGLGICAFLVALRFDMSDPHRVTRRAANGFWLHVLAAPAIVNSVALTLYQNGTGVGLSALILFLAVMAAVAIIIDRRSFLISGIGYMIALVFTVLDGGFGLVILLIGLSLVLLGANWEKLRCWMLNRLPEFPGKDKMPPWRMDDVEA